MDKVRVVDGKKKQTITLNGDGSATINRIGVGGSMNIAPDMFDKFGLVDLVENKPAYDSATHYLTIDNEGLVGSDWVINYVAVEKPVDPVV